MLTVHIKNWGLGLQLVGSGTSLRFQHAGGNEGYRCFLVAFGGTGNGAAVMTNSDSGSALAMEIVRAIAHEYEWPDFKPQERALAKIDPVVYRAYVGSYKMSGGTTLVVSTRDGHVFLKAPGRNETELFPASETEFFITEEPTQFFFVKDSSGRVTGLTIKQEFAQMEARRAN
jgi:hypothetical protein